MSLCDRTLAANDQVPLVLAAWSFSPSFEPLKYLQILYYQSKFKHLSYNSSLHSVLNTHPLQILASVSPFFRQSNRLLSIWKLIYHLWNPLVRL